jgi:hypothetical protein
LAQTELTQSQWQQVMQSTPWKRKRSFRKGVGYPATNISHDAAMQFCQRLTEAERRDGRLPQGWKFALPTEAQWEYACRAGTNTQFSFGADESELGAYAWYDKNTSNVGKYHTHQVAQKKANPWGLFDMHGNADEWCRDWRNPRLPGGTDPEVTGAGRGRVLRGGNWIDSARRCRCARRDGARPQAEQGTASLRVALVVADSAAANLAAAKDPTPQRKRTVSQLDSRAVALKFVTALCLDLNNADAIQYVAMCVDHTRHWQASCQWHRGPARQGGTYSVLLGLSAGEALAEVAGAGDVSLGAFQVFAA